MSVEVFEATEVVRTSQIFEINKDDLILQNHVISIEILPSFRTEAVEDRDVTFNQIQGL